MEMYQGIHWYMLKMGELLLYSRNMLSQVMGYGIPNFWTKPWFTGFQSPGCAGARLSPWTEGHRSRLESWKCVRNSLDFPASIDLIWVSDVWPLGVLRSMGRYRWLCFFGMIYVLSLSQNGMVYPIYSSDLEITMKIEVLRFSPIPASESVWLILQSSPESWSLVRSASTLRMECDLIGRPGCCS